MSRLPPTPPQTIGPFFHGGLLREGMNVMASSDTLGERIRIEGQVRDGDGAPVTDAVVELWQANAQGRYRHAADRRDLPDDPTFTGFGRCGTDDDGRYWFETIRPGVVPGGIRDEVGEALHCHRCSIVDVVRDGIGQGEEARPSGHGPVGHRSKNTVSSGPCRTMSKR